MKLPSFALTLLLLVSGNLHAQQMSYQGRLTDASGAAIPGPTATITFSLWDEQTDTETDTKVWGDFLLNVDLIDGRFSVKLGDAAGNDANGNFLKDEFGGPRYLELTVGTDSPLPRQEVLYSPKAFHSIESDHALLADEATHATNADLATNATNAANAATAGHATTATAIGNPSGGTAPLTVDFTNNRVGIGTEDPDEKLHVEGGRIKVSQSGGGILELANSTRSNYIFTNSTGDLYLRTDSAAHDLILQAAGTQGNVGVGTNNPTSKLHVVGTTSLNGHTTINNRLLINYDGYGFEHKTTNGGTKLHSWLGDTQANFGTASNDPLHLVTNGSVVNLTLLPNGTVGIGTSNPTKGKLEVSGSHTFGIGTHRYYGGDAHYDGSFPGSNLEVSIYASEEVVAARYRAFSDERIKHVTGRSDMQRDLATLQGIKVTDYTYVDTVAKGSGAHKKVIAQQVEKVFPQAVGKSTDVVPDIYKKATIKDGWVELVTDLKQGDRVRLLGESEDGIHEVLEVAEGRFRTAFKPAGDRVFVYGREVDDFRTVDYEAIAMLNVSATQELVRQLAAKDARIAALEKSFAELQSKDEARDTKLAAIEAMLNSDTVQARTVSLSQ